MCLRLGEKVHQLLTDQLKLVHKEAQLVRTTRWQCVISGGENSTGHIFDSTECVAYGLLLLTSSLPGRQTNKLM